MMTETSFWLNFSIHFPWFLLVFLVSGSFKDNRCCKTLQSVWFASHFVMNSSPSSFAECVPVAFFSNRNSIFGNVVVIAVLLFLQLCLRCHGDGSCIEVSESVCGCLCVRRRASKRNVDKVLLYASRLFNTSSCIFIWMNKLLTALSIITNLENDYVSY